MRKIVWLASYPKSGNTWMRILLANYRLADGAAVDINALGDLGLAGSFLRAQFDLYAGIKSSCLGEVTAERLRPAVFRAMAREAKGSLMLKTHDCWRRTDRGEPVFPPDVTASVVYILRNVLDIAPSAAHHWGLGIEDMVTHLCDERYALPAKAGTLSSTLRQPLGSWSTHVRSWVDESGLSPCLVRYEDLNADTANAFSHVVRAIGLDHDECRLRNAVAGADFAVLQAREQTGGFREHSPNAPGRFFRRGKVGSWQDELRPDLIRRLIDAHGDTMRRFGYIDASGYPASLRT